MEEPIKQSKLLPSSLPLPGFLLLLPLCAVLPVCFQGLFSHQLNKVSYSVSTQEHRRGMCLMWMGPADLWRAVDEGLGREEKTGDPLPWPQDWQAQVLSMNDTAELISHRRLLYHCLANSSMKSLGRAGKVVLITRWIKSIRGAWRHCSNALARGTTLPLSWGASVQGEDCMWHSAMASTASQAPEDWRVSTGFQISLGECLLLPLRFCQQEWMRTPRLYWGWGAQEASARDGSQTTTLLRQAMGFYTQTHLSSG